MTRIREFSVRAAESENVYDETLRFANGTSRDIKTEANLVVSNAYQGRSVEGSVNFAGIPYDQVDDGILTQKPCPDSYAGDCISGALVYVHLSDGASSLEEVMLFAVNQL